VSDTICYVREGTAICICLETVALNTREYIKVCYIHGTVHRSSMSINVQQDETIHSLFYL